MKERRYSEITKSFGFVQTGTAKQYKHQIDKNDNEKDYQNIFQKNMKDALHQVESAETLDDTITALLSTANICLYRNYKCNQDCDKGVRILVFVIWLLKKNGDDKGINKILYRLEKEKVKLKRKFSIKSYRTKKEKGLRVNFSKSLSVISSFKLGAYFINNEISSSNIRKSGIDRKQAVALIAEWTRWSDMIKSQRKINLR